MVLRSLLLKANEKPSQRRVCGLKRLKAKRDHRQLNVGFLAVPAFERPIT